MIEPFTEPLLEAADVAVGQEIRAWLRQMDERHRIEQLHRFATSADNLGLRAILTVPPYLAGVSAEALEELREDAAKTRNRGSSEGRQARRARP